MNAADFVSLAASETADPYVRSFVIEPSEDCVGLLGVYFFEGVCVTEPSVRALPYSLFLLLYFLVGLLVIRGLPDTGESGVQLDISVHDP